MKNSLSFSAPSSAPSSARLAPRRQAYWDWRAAGNFIGGGAGGSLLFFSAGASAGGGDFTSLAQLALALVALGLTCVWLEIGRPWRALNVFRHPSTSWMTREASVAPFMFFAGLLALALGGPALTWMSAILGLAFVYSQARILTADKGIPAWRERRCLPLMVASGLTEGAGLLALVSPWLAPATSAWLPPLLTGLLIARAYVWRDYLAGLQGAGAPLPTLRILQGFDAPFLAAGHALPALVLLGSWLDAAAAWRLALAALAGILALAAGWSLKYTLVRRAAYHQGFTLPHQPVRGRPAAKPG